jgi:hypothetical protein
MMSRGSGGFGLQYVTADFSFSVRPVYRKYTDTDIIKEEWEVQRLADGSIMFFLYLTEALLYAENVTTINELSSEARMFWNTVALS